MHLMVAIATVRGNDSLFAENWCLSLFFWYSIMFLYL
jgi:hypothetical protein